MNVTASTTTSPFPSVSSSDPQSSYSRLYALEKLSVVSDYSPIRTSCILIIGIGGIGSILSEMLCRLKIGKLILIDYDYVEEANMNRLFYTPSQIGKSKTEAAKETLEAINPEVMIEVYNLDITVEEGYQKLITLVECGGCEAMKSEIERKEKEGKLNEEYQKEEKNQNQSRVDLVVSCVDNYTARTCINRVCNELNQIWMESGVSEDAVSGHIQMLIPGLLACFECLPPLIFSDVVSNEEKDKQGTRDDGRFIKSQKDKTREQKSLESTLKREGVCTASLPTTMAIIAGFLGQNILKYLLLFGTLSYYTSYSALSDYVPSSILKCNPECSDNFCRKRQREFLDSFALLARQTHENEINDYEEGNNKLPCATKESESINTTKNDQNKKKEFIRLQRIIFELIDYFDFSLSIPGLRSLEKASGSSRNRNAFENSKKVETQPSVINEWGIEVCETGEDFSFSIKTDSMKETESNRHNYLPDSPPDKLRESKLGSSEVVENDKNISGIELSLDELQTTLKNLASK